MSQSVSRRTVLAAGLAAAASTVAVPALAGTAAAGHGDPIDAPVDYRGWESILDWLHGRGQGVRVEPRGRDGIVISRPQGMFDYTDPHTGTTASWEYGTWTGPWHELPFGASELVASWNADTPAGTWIQIEMLGRYQDDTETPWYVLGRWAAGDGDIRRTSVDGQGDPRSTIYTDTFSIDDPTVNRLAAYRLRVTLYRRPGSHLSPRVWRVGAMASDIPDRFEVPASTPGEAAGIELVVPRFSQNIHAGQYPEYDNGGEAWCSPTSSQMILEYWGRKPTAEQLAWVNPAYADPQVCHAARFTYDYQYEGCGNWPFNAAYATTYNGMDAIVTRLRSLADAERLIAAGIPVITSQSFLKTELDGAGYGTSGHLMTVIGFTAEGDVIANDPASPSDEAVRHVYKRRQFENIWLRTKRYNSSGKVVGGSGGVCYLYKPAGKKWPRLVDRRVRVWGD
ncbi:membrane protein [Actinorhabdospora filicis]|uniref:Membrane protein n=1 Tax=Actinorhabdospora filicis TaxID=1785913 RepID=A0A9W6SP40_9ACTN|nr:peptidase C39 family protein [Actinorhabdospora filicis]GLZ79497.1 membrane protein [Actinorhabdospora filicis]